MRRFWLLSTLAFALSAPPLPGRDDRRDINKVGGTILVYEVDEDLSPGGTSMAELARAIRKRLDPADLHAIVVRPAGKSRIEIVLPRGPGDHKKDVERVKGLLQRVGSLEFRILANKHDDAKAIAAAEAFFKAAVKSWKDVLTAVKEKWPDAAQSTANAPVADTVRLAEQIRQHYPKESAADVERFLRASFAPSPEMVALRKRARAGLPPPPPRPADGKAFKVDLEDGQYQVNYAWVELSKNERNNLKLDDSDSKGEAWKVADRARRAGTAFDSGSLLGLGFGDWERLLYSRPARPGSARKYETFVLTRTAEAGQAVTGVYLEKVKAAKDVTGGAAVNFHFNKKGAELLGKLTTANRPPQESAGRRHLAILMDGQVMSAPSLNAIIRDSGQITGKFTKDEIDNLVNLLRSGALPATLKPVPVSEKSVSPAKDGG